MKNFEDIKVKLSLSIGYVVGNRKDEVLLSDYISEEEWKEMDLFEKDKFVHEEIAQPWSENFLDLGFEVEE